MQREGFAQTVEAVAYTWFNGFAALRYRELKTTWATTTARSQTARAVYPKFWLAPASWPGRLTCLP